MLLSVTENKLRYMLLAFVCPDSLYFAFKDIFTDGVLGWQYFFLATFEGARSQLSFLSVFLSSFNSLVLVVTIYL